jgi:hypothetical protein
MRRAKHKRGMHPAHRGSGAGAVRKTPKLTLLWPLRSKNNPHGTLTPTRRLQRKRSLQIPPIRHILHKKRRHSLQQKERPRLLRLLQAQQQSRLGGHFGTEGNQRRRFYQPTANLRNTLAKWPYTTRHPSLIPKLLSSTSKNKPKPSQLQRKSPKSQNCPHGRTRPNHWQRDLSVL